MAKTFQDPNPGMSILEDGIVKKQIARQAQHALEMSDRLKEPRHLTPEQVEAERFQYESNAYAEENALYAAARSAASYLVLPLEPNGTRPLVDPSEASQDSRQLYKWWTELEPNANPGVLLGRKAGLFALYVEDTAAWLRLREMATVERYDEDMDRRYTEVKEIGGASLRLFAPSQPFSVRTRTAWGRKAGLDIIGAMRAERARQPQTFWLVYSYPSVVSGQDAWDYRSKSVLTGVRLLAEGEVLPWGGAILEGGVTVAAPMSHPPEIPLWLAKTIGKPRSRKVMAAARDAYEAAQRAMNARSIAFEAQLRIIEAEARERAVKDREQAERVLADEMAKG
jgi:hypothetical protein